MRTCSSILIRLASYASVVALAALSQMLRKDSFCAQMHKLLQTQRCKSGIDAPISEKAVVREIDDQRIRLHPVLKVSSKQGVNRLLLSSAPEVISKQCQGDCR
jgi:hypothetical protein